MYISVFVTLVVWSSLSHLWLSASAELEKVSLRGYDPGKCNKTNHGSNPTGEYFNPAYDCSDALNKISGAKDGFYWIKLSGNIPKKAYCDMSTDGGAWALIGRKTDAVTWTVPSNNKTVEPFGKPHWSSSLGDAPIVDFRVQVATKEDFSATRAHWSFRLKNKRPLKNLLMLNEGGCGRLWPGIGDISYVKDLQTEEIVTTKFRCSQFSSHHSKSDGYGWDMLNSCLNHPCSPGFAFHKKYPVQMDFSATGASGNTSGIIHDSTSFVGCENHKCCGCFGPVGGKKNYCGTECRAKNGGTIVKNLYTWFWVRSSLPKRVWNKCMEYKVTVAQGKVVWYKLYHGNTVPVMGRCIQNDALLNDGIVVVPDSAAAQKVPPVPGLLEYREDTKRLYVRSNGTWNVIGEQKKVLGKAVEQIKPRFEQLEKKVTNEHKTDFEQLKKSLAELKSQLGSVNKSLNVMKPKVLGESCATLYKSGKRYDGVYTVNYPHDLGSFQVRCDMQTDGGGWTVFQRRQDASVNFYRGWQDYKSGFGDLNGNFWLGLDEIHRLTKSGQNVLRVDLMDWTNETAYAKYGSFSVASESNGYRLDLGSFSGNAGDSLKLHNGMKFSTYNRDNDRHSGRNCAEYYKAAWWYHRCHSSNLNGRYQKAGARSVSGVRWVDWKNDNRSMKKTEMKIRPARF